MSLGIVLIVVGGVVLLGLVIAALVAMWLQDAEALILTLVTTAIFVGAAFALSYGISLVATS